MKNTSGIFLVLAIGGVIGLIVAVIDFLLHAKKICVKERVGFIFFKYFINFKFSKQFSVLYF